MVHMEKRIKTILPSLADVYFLSVEDGLTTEQIQYELENQVLRETTGYVTRPMAKTIVCDSMRALKIWE
jgi:hypothetical protein